MDSPAAGAAGWPVVWWLAAANREVVERERERVGKRERGNGKIKGFSYF